MPYRKLAVTRYGYVVVPGATTSEIMDNAAKVKESDINWEPFSPALMEEAEIGEPCGPNGESIDK